MSGFARLLQKEQICIQVLTKQSEQYSPHSNVFIQTAAATAQQPIKAMTARAHELEDVTMIQRVKYFWAGTYIWSNFTNEI